MGGIRLQLLCGVRIELAVGSLSYPGKSGFPIVSPGGDRLIWIPNSKPCLDVRQNPSRDTHFPSYRGHPATSICCAILVIRVFFYITGTVNDFTCFFFFVTFYHSFSQFCLISVGTIE